MWLYNAIHTMWWLLEEKRPFKKNWPVPCLRKKDNKFLEPKKTLGYYFYWLYFFLVVSFWIAFFPPVFFEWKHAPARQMTYLKEYTLFWSPSPYGVNYSSPSLTYHLFRIRFVDTHIWQACFLTLTLPFLPLFFLLVLLLFCPLPLLVSRWSASRSH